MSNDDDYASFLEKANQDTGSSSVQSSSFAQTKAVDTDVPAALQSLDDAFYMSESDEPFEPVALKFGGKTLDERAFAKLIAHSGDVESSSLSSWNVKGQYDNVVDAVKTASGGKHDVKVFRVAHGNTRCEYYVVAQSPDGNVVGVKARAVET